MYMICTKLRQVASNTIESEENMKTVKPLHGNQCCPKILKMFLFYSHLFQEEENKSE